MQPIADAHLDASGLEQGIGCARLLGFAEQDEGPARRETESPESHSTVTLLARLRG
jgi:hypothetical protein